MQNFSPIVTMPRRAKMKHSRPSHSTCPWWLQAACTRPQPKHRKGSDCSKCLLLHGPNLHTTWRAHHTVMHGFHGVVILVQQNGTHVEPHQAGSCWQPMLRIFGWGNPAWRSSVTAARHGLRVGGGHVGADSAGCFRKQASGTPQKGCRVCLEAGRLRCWSLARNISGLTNRRAPAYYYLIHVPTTRAATPLNLAGAVAICLYELRRAGWPDATAGAACKPRPVRRRSSCLTTACRPGADFISLRPQRLWRDARPLT